MEFKDLAVKEVSTGLEGNKIPIDTILNRTIIVEDYQIKPSKFEKKTGNGMCLYLQFKMNDYRHIVFTSSICLMEMIQQISKDHFPFETTITKKDKRLLFT
jgi:hypothetical protein